MDITEATRLMMTFIVAFFARIVYTSTFDSLWPLQHRLSNKRVNCHFIYLFTLNTVVVFLLPSSSVMRPMMNQRIKLVPGARSCSDVTVAT